MWDVVIDIYLVKKNLFYKKLKNSFQKLTNLRIKPSAHESAATTLNNEFYKIMDEYLWVFICFAGKMLNDVLNVNLSPPN